MSDLNFPITFDGPAAPWFVEPAFRRVYSGAKYGARCVAAIGPADFSRVAFLVTSNPRQKAGLIGRETGTDLLVHECVWSIGQTARRVHAEVAALLEKAKRPVLDGFVTIPKSYLKPLLQLAAEKAGVPIDLHASFHRGVLDQESQKLRASLAKTGLSPAIVAAHYYV